MDSLPHAEEEHEATFARALQVEVVEALGELWASISSQGYTIACPTW